MVKVVFILSGSPLGRVAKPPEQRCDQGRRAAIAWKQGQ